ncbi:DUF4097 family beta strand repeat-containing protein [Neobacillus kokaensis]|uniref:DUF4097 domain-containing protein n=1 Tax=Neobacillus kokaensis TaxID=2759023 RepID=A0ABQ3MXW7_9BACI|nr:DUF4097 domain-containing protein [Neobacillus kokaensis]GHH97523.1 hypothetical protein AM1BK_10660 [Neobacillus kokaensis]
MKEERKRILKLVEEGKVTVDEAISLMEELEKAQLTADQKKEQMINELSTVVQFEEAKKEDPFQTKYQSTKDKIFEFVDSALKKIKEFDFDFNFGQSVDISHIFHQGDVELKDLDVDIANGSVKIAVWDQPDVRVECQAKVYRVDNQDQARQNFLRDVVFEVEGQKLKFNTQQKWMKVDALVFVPKAQYERMRIRLFNGPIAGSDMDVDDLRMKTANGKITLNDVNAKRGEIETANGKIQVLKSQIDELEAETINGAISLEGDFKKTEAQSFNGNISYNLNGNRCEWLHAKTTSGAVDLFVPETLPINGELKTNLGGFNLKLTGVQILEEKSEMIQKLLRFQSIHHPDKMVKIYAETKTGSISLQKAVE